MGAFLLLLVALLLIFLEFFLPGGIMGTAGALFAIASIIVFAFSGHSPLATFLFAGGVIAAVVVVIKFSLARVKRAPPETGLFEEQDQAGFHAAEYDRGVIGEEGSAFSDLKPSGHVTVHGTRYQAVSERGYINKGSKVIVKGGRGAYLIVKIKTEDETS